MVAILMVLIVGTVFFSFSKRDAHQSFTSTESRVHSMEGFLDDVGRDSERAAYIAGFRSLIAMEQEVATTGLPFNGSNGVSNLTPDTAFMESFVNGSINGKHYVIMDNSTFSEYLLKVQDNAQRQGFICNISVENITLWQTDPWHLRVNYTLSFKLYDVSRLASWNTNRTFIGKIPITDIRDPLFTMRTFNRVQQTIRPNLYPLFVNTSAGINNTRGLAMQYNESLYVAAGRGPSILMRFSNNLSDSIYGIESFVDIGELSAQNIVVNSDASSVDYLYFKNIPAVACGVNNGSNSMIDAFKIDAAHIAVYQIDRLNYTSCS
jgi:hypothetical protein